MMFLQRAWRALAAIAAGAVVGLAAAGAAAQGAIPSPSLGPGAVASAPAGPPPSPVASGAPSPSAPHRAPDAGDGQPQPVPALTAHVIDRTGTLDASQLASLESQLAGFEQEAGSQVVVLMVPTTQPEDIASYSYRVADAWKIGRRDVGDGLLVVVAKDDHHMRIEVARALEGAVPDLAARQIMDRVMRPAFRAGDYAGGLRAGLDQLFARIRAEHLAPGSGRNVDVPRAAHHGGSGGGWSQLALLLFVAVPVVGGVLRAILGRPLGSLATGAGVGGLALVLGTGVGIALLAGIGAAMLSGVMGVGGGLGRRGGGVFFPPGIGGGGWGGGGGGFGGGGGGGGFSSGGGGSFGGGGASGDW